MWYSSEHTPLKPSVPTSCSAYRRAVRLPELRVALVRKFPEFIVKGHRSLVLAFPSGYGKRPGAGA